MKSARILDDFFYGCGDSFKEAYVLMTGDKNVSGLYRDCDSFAMREAMGTATFPEVLGGAINRRIVDLCKCTGLFDGWKEVAKVVNVKDFRNQRIMSWGGFGDLPIVAEGAPYLDQPAPPEGGESYAVNKRGGLFSVTLEMIKNDDVDAIRALPEKITEAAQRTLARFVFDMLKGDGVQVDGAPLYSVGRNNLGSAALSHSALSAARLAIAKQQVPLVNDRTGAKAAHLLVPLDLEEAAHDILFYRGASQDQTFLQKQGVKVVPVWCWDDPNDWVLAASAHRYPTLEVGFLDGKQEPEVFLQDAPTVGSMFTNDMLTWKVRHIYGGAVVDYRGLYKSAVA